MAGQDAPSGQVEAPTGLLQELRASAAHLISSLTQSDNAGGKAPLQRQIPLPVPAFLCAFLAQQLLTTSRRATPATMLAAGVVSGIASEIGISSLREFHRKETSPSPLQPEAASKLVTTGPNSYTRNPMYLAMGLVLAANAVARRSFNALVPLAGYVAAVQHWQIRAEEDALTVLFAEDYQRYCQQVPRWVDLRSVRINALALGRILSN